MSMTMSMTMTMEADWHPDFQRRVRQRSTTGLRLTNRYLHPPLRLQEPWQTAVPGYPSQAGAVASGFDRSAHALENSRRGQWPTKQSTAE
jgi:hypothetical protein